MGPNIPVVPLLITAIAGVADGVVAGTDVKAGRTDFTKQHETFLQGGLLVAGLLGGLARIHPDYTEPLMFGGTFGAARRGGLAIYDRNNTPPPQPGGTGGPIFPPQTRYAGLPPAGAPNGMQRGLLSMGTLG